MPQALVDTLALCAIPFPERNQEGSGVGIKCIIYLATTMLVCASARPF